MPIQATFPDISQYISKGGQALGIVPSWLVHALAEIGQAEVHGAGTNLRIASYWKGADIEQRKIKVGTYDLSEEMYGAVPLTVGGRAVG